VFMVSVIRGDGEGGIGISHADHASSRRGVTSLAGELSMCVPSTGGPRGLSGESLQHGQPEADECCRQSRSPHEVLSFSSERVVWNQWKVRLPFVRAGVFQQLLRQPIADAVERPFQKLVAGAKQIRRRVLPFPSSDVYSIVCSFRCQLMPTHAKDPEGTSAADSRKPSQSAMFLFEAFGIRCHGCATWLAFKFLHRHPFRRRFAYSAAALGLNSDAVPATPAIAKSGIRGEKIRAAVQPIQR
jgi:hypothetical protein